MASLPFLDYTQITAIASGGGYSRHIQLSERSNLLILCVLAIARYRWLWETTLFPIPDAEYQQIVDAVAQAEEEVMSNFSIGSIFASVANLTDDSVILLDGTPALQTDYPELALVVPPSWLFGLNIVLPDMRERGLFGADVPANLGIAIGENTVQLTESEMPAHTHTQQPHAHTENSVTIVPTAAGLEPALASLVSLLPTVTGNATAVNNSTGGDIPHNNIQRSLTVNWYIIGR